MYFLKTGIVILHILDNKVFDTLNLHYSINMRILNGDRKIIENFYYVLQIFFNLFSKVYQGLKIYITTKIFNEIK